MTQRMIDPRQPRFGQALTGTALLAGFLASWEPVIPVIAVILAGASLLGPRANLYAHLFILTKRWLRLGPPKELEESGPPRFSNTLGFVFLGAAATAHYAAGATTLAWGLGLMVSALALLAAVTGLCVGCELYVIGRRVLTRGRVPHRVTSSPRGGG